MDQRLKFCKLCENQKYSAEGLVCGLTMQKPTFVDSCPEFNPSEKEMDRSLRQQESFSNEVAEESGSGWKNILWIIILIFAVIRIIMRMSS
ncbi:hypothetical protein M0M57_00395 [Flavobacterium azooxidireducens]|uniref:Uncharacterized protein n=1 Tax=Flavobacterium azooxidireducens TaxID=1871076 RepID=A0ABY4KIV2_9FLAO|nr:hypothetical protein [Flavobacterium azooxidireducens]UPQ79315.1 hypothetical protein M0M57_00395 [Flavobacterium azooxidireducens]